MKTQSRGMKTWSFGIKAQNLWLLSAVVGAFGLGLCIGGGPAPGDVVVKAQAAFMLLQLVMIPVAIVRAWKGPGGQ